jgi:hypothetical protein
MKNKTIKLSEGENGKAIRFLSRCKIELAEGKTTSTVTVTRTGTFTDSRYGRFEISKDMLLAMVKNFKAGTYGQDIFLDVDHKPGNGAAAKIINLSVEGNRLRAEVEWTQYGIEAVRDKGYQYLSAEYSENYTDNEAGHQHGPVLLGAALTVRPVIKHLDPVRLSEASASDHPLLIHPELVAQLSEELNTMYKNYLERLTAALTAFKLSTPVVGQLCGAFETTAKELGEDQAKLDKLFTNFEATGKQLAEQIGDKTVTLSINTPAPSGEKLLSEDDVKRMLAEDRDRREQEAKTLAEKLTTNKDLFNKLLSEAEGLKGLDEEAKKTLAAAADLITADMSAEQVTKLAEHQISIGNTLSVNTQLAALGYRAAGTVQLTQTDQRTALSLQDSIISALKQTNEFAAGKLKLAEKVSPFIEKVLSEFDRLNAPAIAAEVKRLAGGTTGMADTSLPIGFQRTVIREALSDLRVLELVSSLTDFTAAVTTQIPYETRDGSAILNDGIVYEGAPIHRASVKQGMDTAYILPMKLAFIISNEVMHFSRVSAIDWDAYGRNVASNAQFMRELIVRRICNTLQRAADSYLSATVIEEDYSEQLDGATVSIIKTTQFPIVRQYQQRDLQGNAIGNPTNPIVVKHNNFPISEYDGTGNQAAGTYYRITNYNLGYVQFVSEAGAPVFPGNLANTHISYSYATNIAKFDLDNGSVEMETHLNGLLRVVGRRKAIMADDRFVRPDFMLSCETLNDTITNAKQFTESGKKSGTDTTTQGDLSAIKGIPAWSTNAPSTDLGSERLIIGQRGTLTYTIAKPFETGAPFEVVDAQGKPTGQKQAYGEEYSALKVPDVLRNRLTSVIAYSASGR